jgi:hypothetical protein
MKKKIRSTAGKRIYEVTSSQNKKRAKERYVIRPHHDSSINIPRNQRRSLAYGTPETSHRSIFFPAPATKVSVCRILC